MKFSHQLKFNAVPEWRTEYLDYSKLKKLSYTIERLEEEARQAGELDRRSLDLERVHASFDGGESGPLLPWQLSGQGSFKASFESSLEQMHNEFRDAVKAQEKSAVEFSTNKQAELLGRLQRVNNEIRSAESDANVSMVDEVQAFWDGKHDTEEHEGIVKTLKGLYIQLNDIKNFITTNREGFRKILKKHDKVTERELMAELMPDIASHLSVADEGRLEQAREAVLALYAKLAHGGNQRTAKVQLERMLRDTVHYDRGTVWRDMVALERTHTTARVERPGGPSGPYSWRKAALLGLSVTVFLAMLEADIVDGRVQQKCLAMVVLLSLLWCTEAVPLYVTSMLVPLLVVTLGVLPLPEDPSQALPAEEAAKHVFQVQQQHATRGVKSGAERRAGFNDCCSDGDLVNMPCVERVVMRDLMRYCADRKRASRCLKAKQSLMQVMFSPVIMLLLGGFAIAAALSKHYIAKAAATSILSRVHRPQTIVLATMFVATFASMWISNVAAPVLVFSIIQPILRRQAHSHPLSKSLVMGVAMASNVGGMTSPISSPQNIFAIDLMSESGKPPNWLSWFAVAVPVAIACNFAIWFVILATYRPGLAASDIRPLRAPSNRISATQVIVIVVSALTVLLWCGNTILSKYLGNQGIVAILPLVVFFGSGILEKDDFNTFLWHVVMLAQGGLVLSDAVRASGILARLAEWIQHESAGFSVWAITALFCALVLVCTTFISHTVGAMVILPVVQTVGAALDPPHPRLLVLATALMCSGAMGLPVSGFPNMNAVALEDATGQTYVSTPDFLRVGLLSSAVAWAVIVSLGYGVMYCLGY